jgi:hypothetical protein
MIRRLSPDNFFESPTEEIKAKQGSHYDDDEKQRKSDIVTQIHECVQLLIVLPAANL